MCRRNYCNAPQAQQNQASLPALRVEGDVASVCLDKLERNIICRGSVFKVSDLNLLLGAGLRG